MNRRRCDLPRGPARARPAARAYLRGARRPAAAVAALRARLRRRAGAVRGARAARRRAVAAGLGLLTVPGRSARSLATTPPGSRAAPGARPWPGGSSSPSCGGGQPILVHRVACSDGADADRRSPVRRAPKYRNLRGARPVLGHELVAGRRGGSTWSRGRSTGWPRVAWGLPACCTCGTALPADRLGFLAAAETVFGALRRRRGRARGATSARFGAGRWGRPCARSTSPTARPQRAGPAPRRAGALRGPARGRAARRCARPPPAPRDGGL